MSLVDRVRLNTVLQLKRWSSVRAPIERVVLIYEFKIVGGSTIEIYAGTGAADTRPDQQDYPEGGDDDMSRSAPHSLPDASALRLLPTLPQVPDHLHVGESNDHEWNSNQSPQGTDYTYKLPPEITSEIIYTAVLAEEKEHPWYWGASRARYQILIAYASVSSAWLKIVLSTPRLWSKVNGGLGHHVEAVSLFLQRSGGVPLDIEIGYAEEDVMNMLHTHISRWKSFSGTILRPSKVADYFGGKSAPQLEHLTIQSTGHNLFHVPNLLNDDAQRLRHLSLFSVTVPWDSPRLSQLRSLHISDTGTDGRPSDLQFYDLLGHCSGLEYLYIYGHPFLPNRHGSEATRLDPIYMPSLKQLILRGVSRSVTLRILASIFTSPSDSDSVPFIHLTDMPERLTITDLERIANFEPRTILGEMVAHLVGLKIIYEGWSTPQPSRRCVVEGSVKTSLCEPHLKMSYIESAFDSSLTLFHVLIPRGVEFSKIRTLNMQLPPLSADRDLTRQLQRLPLLEELILSSPTQLPDFIRLGAAFRLGAVFDVLGLVAFVENTEGIRNAPDWLCPRLKVIRMRGIHLRVDALLDMLKLRYGLDPHTAHLNLPASIELLEILDDVTNSEALIPIKSIIETKGTFRWEPKNT
ncbi:hypothetical protein FRC02_000183 [Tulasnella sp. 418]|nr:hypothetical protein FRC02_000183 [Tulasnella sp. 418]